MWCESDEPCVFGGVSRAGFPSDIAFELGEVSLGGAFGSDGFEHRSEDVGDVLIDSTVLFLYGDGQVFAVFCDIEDEFRRFIDAVSGDGGVGVGDVECCHARAAEG